MNLFEQIPNHTVKRKLTAREAAVVRYVWKLTAEEQALLNLYFNRDCTPAQLADLLDAGAGKIVVNHTGYYPLWEGSSKERLTENSKIELSFRANFVSHMSVVIIRVKD